MLTELQKAQSHSILLRKTQALAQMEQCERELDIPDALVEKTIDSLRPPSFLREMDQRFPRGNCLAHTTVAKSEASPA